MIVIQEPTDADAPYIYPEDTVYIHYEAGVVSTKKVFVSTYED